MRAQQGGLKVQGFLGVADEGRGDGQGGAVDFLLDEGGGGRVPGRVAAGLEGGTGTARGKGGGVRLTLDQGLAVELGQGFPVAVWLQEGVVFLGRQAGQGVEPMGVVGSSVRQGPLAHALGHLVGDRSVQGLAFFRGRAKFLVNLLRQMLLLGRVVKHEGPVDFMGGQGLIFFGRRMLIAQHQCDLFTGSSHGVLLNS